MKLSEYIESLKQSLEQDGDLDVIYSVDEEGNGYHQVTSVGGYMYVESLQDYYLEPIAYEEILEYESPVKVFCIN